MSSDLELESWLDSKSRREFRKYSTGHSYKQKKIEIKKNEYIEITNKNPLLNTINISMNKKSSKNINIPENCIFRKDKRDNVYLANLLNNVKINTDRKINDDKYNVIDYRDEESGENYIIKYDLVQPKDKIEAISSNKLSDKNNNKVRRERIKKPKIVQKNIEKPTKLDNSIAAYNVIQQDFKGIRYKKKQPQKVSGQKVRKTNFKNHKEDYNEFLLSIEDTVLEQDFPDRIDGLGIIGHILSNTEFSNKNSIEFIPLIARKASTDYFTVKQEFFKNLKNSSSKKIINEICEICFVESEELISLNDCNHRACLICWQTYSETIIKSFKVYSKSCFHLNCLHNDCNNQLGINFLTSILPESIVNKYKEFYCELRLEKSDKYARCLNEKCNRVILINRNSIYNISICECNYMICNKCHQSAHYPVSCEEELKFRKDINLDNHKKEMDIEGKLCPNCITPIEKNGGCNHMK